MGKKLIDIEKELKKALIPALKQTAVQINGLIEDEFEHAVYAFYQDYEPKYYRRTYSTYYASSLYDNDEGLLNPKELSEGLFEAGISVSSDNIPGQPYYKKGQHRPDKEWVFKRTYYKGIHGHDVSEKVSFGKNKYWQNYLKATGKKYKQYNQYKVVRNKRLLQEGDIIKMGRKKSFYLPIKDWKSFQMTGYIDHDRNRTENQHWIQNKPDKIMKYFYKQVVSKKNINNLIMTNLLTTITRK